MQTLKASALALHALGMQILGANAGITPRGHRGNVPSKDDLSASERVLANDHLLVINHVTTDQASVIVLHGMKTSGHDGVNVPALVIDHPEASGQNGASSVGSVIAHHVVRDPRLVIGRRVLIAHVLTGTAHPGMLKAEKNILREHLGNVRLNALALGRDRDRETVRALVNGHASEQDPHQVTDGLAVKAAASAIDRQEVNVRRAATVRHAVKGEALGIARHVVIAPKEVTVLRGVIVHHAVKGEALEPARHAVIAPKEVTVHHEVIVHHAAPVKDEVLEIARHAVITPKEVTVHREVIVHHAAPVKDEALVIGRHAAQNVPPASAMMREAHGAAPDPSTLDRLLFTPVRRTRAGTPSTVYGTGVLGVIQRPVTLLWNEKDSSRSDSPPHTQPDRLRTRQGPAPCTVGIRRGHDQAGIQREPVRSVAARGGSDPRCRAGCEFLS
jgi:hypothetical protein